MAAPDGWTADVVHGHDWQAGLARAYLRLGDAGLPPSMLHHPQHRLCRAVSGGAAAAARPARLALPPRRARILWRSLLPQGRAHVLRSAHDGQPDLCAGSPQHRSRHGISRACCRRAATDFCGILNGIDETVWNPETDPLIAAPFLSAFACRQAGQSGSRRNPASKSRHGCGGAALHGGQPAHRQKGLDLLAAALPICGARRAAGPARLRLLPSSRPSLRAPRPTIPAGSRSVRL